MELILKRISDLPEQTAASLTGDELTIVGNNGVLQLVPLSAIYANAQSQLNNVANYPVVTLQEIQNQDLTAEAYITYPLLAQAIQSLGVLLTPQQQQAFLQHLDNYSNPHQVTAEQVGLGNVANLPILTETDIENNDVSEKYVTYNVLQAAVEALGFRDLNNVANYPPTTLSDIQNGIFGETYLTYNLLSQAVQSLNIVLPPLLRTEFLAHLTNYNNPHETTAEQVGLGNVVNLPVLTEANIQAGDTSLEVYVTYNLLGDAISSLPNTGILTPSQKSALLAHLVNYDNPHQTTAALVGLGNVANLLPIASTDITNVEGGAAPADVYVTYNELQAANISLGFKTGAGINVAISISNPTLTSVTITAQLSATNIGNLNNTVLAFNYQLTSATSWSTFQSVNYNNSLTYTEVITGLQQAQNYNFQVILTSNVISGLQVASNTVSGTTAGGTQLDSAMNFDIVSVGGTTTTAMTSSNVVLQGMDIVNNVAVATSGNASISTPTITQTTGEPDFVGLQANIAYRPKNLLTQQTPFMNRILLTSAPSESVGSSDTFLVNDSTSLSTITNNQNVIYKSGVSFVNELNLGNMNTGVISSTNNTAFDIMLNYNINSSTTIVYGLSYNLPIQTATFDLNKNTFTSDFSYSNVTMAYGSGGMFVLEGSNPAIISLGGWQTPPTNSNNVATNVINSYSINSTTGAISSPVQIGTLPTTLINFALAANNRFIYIAGGYTDWYLNSAGQPYLNNTANTYYTTISSTGSIGSWNSGPNLPVGGRMLGGIVFNNVFYVMGGGANMLNNNGSPFIIKQIFWSTINSDGSLNSWQTYNTGLDWSFSEGYFFTYQERLFYVGLPVYINSSGDWVHTNMGLERGQAIMGYIYEVQLDQSGNIVGFFPYSQNKMIGEVQIAGNTYPTLYYGAGVLINNYLIQSYIRPPQNEPTNYAAGVAQLTSIELSTNKSLNSFVNSYNNLPVKAAYIRSVVYNGYIYCLGGNSSLTEYKYNTNTSQAPIISGTNIFAIDNVFSYQVSNGNTLSNLQNLTALPVALFGGGTCIVDGTLFYIGGININGQRVNTIYYNSINSNGTINSWTESTINLPVPIFSFGLIVVDIPNSANTYIYIIGGDSTNRTNSVYQITVSNGTVTAINTVNPLPTTLGFFNPVFINGYIYIVDGSTSSPNNAMNTIEYEPLALRCVVNSDGSLGNWEWADDINFYTPPSGSDGTAIGIIGNYLYRFGGYSGNIHLNSMVRAFIYENGNLGPWEETDIKLNHGINHSSVITLENIMYTFGGEVNMLYYRDSNDGNSNTNGFWVSDFDHINYFVDGEATLELISGYTLPSNAIGIYHNVGRVATGTIGSSTGNLTPNGSPTIVGNALIQSYNTYNANGTTLSLAMTDLNEGDEIIELQGNVYN